MKRIACSIAILILLVCETSFASTYNFSFQSDQGSLIDVIGSFSLDSSLLADHTNTNNIFVHNLKNFNFDVSYSGTTENIDIAQFTPGSFVGINYDSINTPIVYSGAGAYSILAIYSLAANSITMFSPIIHQDQFTINGKWTVTSVPIPASAWMLGLGLAGLLGIRKVRKS